MKTRSNLQTSESDSRGSGPISTIALNERTSGLVDVRDVLH
jgi:hypothetical protein